MRGFFNCASCLSISPSLKHSTIGLIRLPPPRRRRKVEQHGRCLRVVQLHLYRSQPTVAEGVDRPTHSHRDLQLPPPCTAASAQSAGRHTEGCIQALHDRLQHADGGLFARLLPCYHDRARLGLRLWRLAASSHRRPGRRALQQHLPVSRVGEHALRVGGQVVLLQQVRRVPGHGVARAQGQARLLPPDLPPLWRAMGRIPRPRTQERGDPTPNPHPSPSPSPSFSPIAKPNA
eukprot:scaffold121977_cov51-Phaeocystis_antarctica.AAC.1